MIKIISQKEFTGVVRTTDLEGDILCPSGNPNHNSVSKYLISRFIQMVDGDEVISYQYPTLNGMLLLKEIYEISEICLKRPKSYSRLKSLLEESSDKNIQESIVNDDIIKSDFSDIIVDIKKWKNEKITSSLIQEINQKISSKYLPLENKYLLKLEARFKALDLQKNNISDFKKIDKYLKCFISHLVHLGYSLHSLRDIATKLPFININRIFSILFDDGYLTLNKTVDRDLYFYIYTHFPIDEDLIQQLNAKELPKKTFNNEITYTYEFKAKGKDPLVTFIKKIEYAWKNVLYNNLDKELDTLSKIWTSECSYSETQSSQNLGEEQILYHLINPTLYNYYGKITSNIPAARKPSSLNKTLKNINKNMRDFPTEILSIVEESIYFYHLALNVPSLETSYILLWTSLEGMMGIKSNKSDIETIQENVAKTLAIGAVCRRIKGTVQRLIATLEANSWQLRVTPPSSSENTEQGIYDWIEWLIAQYTKDDPNDPYHILKHDPLLCKQYMIINEEWKKNNDLIKIINNSKLKSEYQLERLYLKRNQIIHKGKLENLRECFWNHLEWYVGKILCQVIISLGEIHNTSDISSVNEPIDLVFKNLIKQYDNTINYLSSNNNQSITVNSFKISEMAKFSALYV